MNRHRRMEAKAARRRARTASNRTPKWVRDKRDERLLVAGSEAWEQLGRRLRQPPPRTTSDLLRDAA